MCSRFVFLLSPLLFLNAAACSVLEQRENCPCILHIDLSDKSNLVTDSVYVHVASNSFLHTAHVLSAEYDSGVDIKVPGRGGVSLNVIDARARAFDDGGTIVIPFGEQCPELYMFSCFCDTSSDEGVGYVRLCKNYCKVSVSFATDNPGKYSMAVMGNVCGYSREGEPMDGMFRYEPFFSGSSAGSFCLPRQKDSSLKLCITTDGGSTRYFALGSYISDSGYDWQKEDLDDVAVSIDYAVTSIRITVDDWETEIPLEVVI